MTIDYQKLRLDGIYQQDQDGNLMLRVKIPAGVLSSPQAAAISAISEVYSNGMLHLTSRGSIEFHWLHYEQLPDIFRRLAAVGLTSRGACGGAVRGISCSTTLTSGFTAIQTVARRINRHFAGNPHFEGLPKKFKIGVDAGYAGARHLIQDLGLVHVGETDGERLFDVWCAGGLGREPQAGFLLEKDLPERWLIPVIEAVVQVYRDNTPPPKRLKHLLRQVGEETFRGMFEKELERRPEPVPQHSVEAPLTLGDGELLEVPVFAGELPAGHLRRLADTADQLAGGYLALSADQNVCLLLAADISASQARQALIEQGIPFNQPEQQVNFRVCPGSHECRMGLAATRPVAKALIAEVTSAISDKTCGLTWAISGCPNSCSQPQLADIGILTVKSQKTDDGSRRPLFDLYRRTGDAFGSRVAQALTLDDLCQLVRTLDG